MSNKKNLPANAWGSLLPNAKRISWLQKVIQEFIIDKMFIRIVLIIFCIRNFRWLPWSIMVKRQCPIKKIDFPS
jgi:hypothetical protein